MLNKNLKIILPLIILAELWSFLGYFYPLASITAFFIVSALTITLSIYKLEYGLYILLTELFIGSFGYIFYWPAGKATVSLRIALWLIIMSIWAVKKIKQSIRTKKISIDFLNSSYFKYFAVLLAFIIWGVINGRLNGNALSNIFNDFNNWLFLLLIFPIYDAFKTSENWQALKSIFLASITFLSLKTILLAYIFSHNFGYWTFDLYRWLRESGLAEITLVQSGFSRVFMQSQIYILIGFFILLFYLLMNIRHSQEGRNAGAKNLIAIAMLAALFLSCILISFSRSFWLGLAGGLIFTALTVLLKIKIKFRQFIIFCGLQSGILILSLLITFIAIKLPYPSPAGGFNPADLLEQRATQITGEAGASSRWQLLPELWKKIKSAPLLGRGFGETVTYKSNDPRIIETTPDSMYTTYAFEWGWLDIWLKLGLFGLLAYLILHLKIIYNGLKINSNISLALITCLIAIIIIHVFSPYLNHPLGIGFLLLAIGVLNREQAIIPG